MRQNAKEMNTLLAQFRSRDLSTAAFVNTTAQPKLTGNQCFTKIAGNGHSQSAP
jgi:hypothetical protein